MKPPAASPGRAEKPQLSAPAPPGLARLLLSKSRRGGRSRRAPATSPMFVSRGRSRASDGEPSSPKVTCIGQVRMRNKGKTKKQKAAAAGTTKPDKAAANKKGYCRCLKKAFLCGGLFEFDRRRRAKAPPPPPQPELERERTRRSPWVFSSRDVAVAAAPKPVDARSGKGGETEEEEDEMEVGVGVFRSVGKKEEINGGKDVKEENAEEPQLVSSATTTPPKNALLLMRCRSAPQNRTSPLTSRFLVAAAPSPSPTRDDNAPAEIAALYLSPSPRKPEKLQASPAPSPSPRRRSEKMDGEQRQGPFAAVHDSQAEDREEADEEEEDDEMRCSSARPLVLQRCKSEPATTAAAKMEAGPASDATTAGCFWANGGSSGRRRHAPVALTGH